MPAQNACKEKDNEKEKEKEKATAFLSYFERNHAIFNLLAVYVAFLGGPILDTHPIYIPNDQVRSCGASESQATTAHQIYEFAERAILMTEVNFISQINFPDSFSLYEKKSTCTAIYSYLHVPEKGIFVKYCKHRT